MIRRSHRAVTVAVVAIVGLMGLAVTWTPFRDNATATTANQLLFSSSPTRSPASPLGGSTLAGSVAIFVPSAGSREVDFYLDNPATSGAPTRQDTSAPFDLVNGTKRRATLFDTTRLPDGRHTLTARVVASNGTASVMSADFTVTNVAPTPDPVVSSPSVAPTSSPPVLAATSSPPVAPSATRPPAPTPPQPVTTVPAGAVAISPGDSVQAVVDQHPAGSVYFLRAGTYVNQTITPKSGDTFLGEPGTVLTGSGVVQESFRGTATDVTIRGMVVEHYAPSAAPNGAIDPDPGGGAARWLIDDVEVRYNSPGAGIKLAEQSTIQNSHVDHNGKVGITAWRVSGGVIQNTEIAYNNWDPNNPASTTGLYDYNNDAGGAKFVSTTGLTLRNNTVHNNIGIGLWCDIDCRNTVIAGNNVHDNAAAGIMYEISYGATISGNTITSNGLTGTRPAPGAGILVSESSNVEAYSNVVTGNAGGILGKQDAINGRGSAPYGPYVLDNLYVHDNDITSPLQTAGVQQYVNDLSYFSSRNIRFQRNTYRGVSSFFWNDQVLSPAAWRAAGLDVDGTWL